MSVYGEGLYLTEDGERVTDARRSPARLRSRLWDPVTRDGPKMVPIGTDETKNIDLASICALTKYAQEHSALVFADSYPVEG
jgi:dTDP-L-rhamnose 4-epimerase